MNDFTSEYTACSNALLGRVYKVAEDAKLPKYLTEDIVKAGRLILQSKSAQQKEVRITANELVDLLERLYAKTGQQFMDIIKRLAHGALSVPEERLREWYATAMQIANFYTRITPEEQKRIGDVLSESESPDSLRNRVTALHQEEVMKLLKEHPSLSASRNGRASDHAHRTKSTWRTGKEKQV
ncbi:MAG: hypothetical protein QXM31_03690 [Candidatus Woesearchaeota archaeon]